MVCRVRVDARAGVIELEGEAAFVSSFFEKMLPLIEQSGFGTGLPEQSFIPNGQAEAAPTPAQDETKQQKSKKKKRTNPPAGASCRDRVLTLKADGFFKDHRTLGDIVSGLAKKGWTHNNSQAGAALTHMFNRGEIQRTNDGSGFAYYWDRD